MLQTLSIRDLVLIERAELALAPGLTVLTGETGAGKSILLDGLGLVLGERADSAMVRRGCAQAAVAADFRLPTDHPALAFLDDNGLPPADEPGHILIRRQLKADGGSRAFVNDAPVSVTLLRQLGALLVEIHGQHDERGLLNPRGHLDLVDLYAGHDELLAEVAARHRYWQQLRTARQEAAARAEQDARELDWLEHANAELEELAPLAGEEAELANLRQTMQQGAKLAESLDLVDALISADSGALSSLRQAARRLERMADADAGLAQALEAIDRALVEGDAIEAALASARDRFTLSPDALDRAETRLFELRAMARKHKVEPDALPALADELAARLEAARGASDDAEQLEQQEAAALAQLSEAAARLTQSRHAAALKLDTAVNAELPALKLENARFRTAIAAVLPGASGADQLHFEVATNAATGFGALTHIASGGELSRFILALKVVLSRSGTAGTLVFDEIDRGVGGATASAIGTRLAKVAAGAQVLVVTHSPQVAASGAHHAHISKASGSTIVTPLSGEARLAEIARMLSGAEITAEARAQAARLLG